MTVNGIDFAVLESTSFVPSRPQTEFALIALRAGCDYNGVAKIGPYNKYVLNTRHWYVGLSC